MTAITSVPPPPSPAAALANKALMDIINLPSDGSDYDDGVCCGSKKDGGSPRGVLDFPGVHTPTKKEHPSNHSNDNILEMDNRENRSDEQQQKEKKKSIPKKTKEVSPTILLVVVDPSTTRFELLQIQTEDTTTINDVTQSIIATTADDFNLAELQYQAICNYPHGNVLLPTTRLWHITERNKKRMNNTKQLYSGLVSNENNNDNDGDVGPMRFINTILIAVPWGSTPSKCTTFAKGVLCHRDIVKMLERNGMNTKELLHVDNKQTTTSNNNKVKTPSKNDKIDNAPIMSVATTDREEEEVDKSMYFFESPLPPTSNILIKDDNDEIYDDNDDEDENHEWMFPNLISSGSYAEFDKTHSAAYVDNDYFKNNTCRRQQPQPPQQEQATSNDHPKQAITEFVSERLEI